MHCRFRPLLQSLTVVLAFGLAPALAQEPRPGRTLQIDVVATDGDPTIDGNYRLVVPLA